MKYKLLLTLAGLCLLALPQLASANISEYFFSQSNGSGTNMSSATTIMGPSNDDFTVGAFPIGFTFNFDGTNYTEFSACSNGWMKLGAATTNASLSNGFFSGAPFPMITALWDDLRTYNTGGYIRYLTEGQVGSRVLTVEWMVSYWASPYGGPWTIQVRLYETTNMIEFVYVSMPPNYSTSATIGFATDANNYVTVTPGTPQASSSTTSQNNNVNITVTPIADGTIYTFSKVLDDLACDSVWFNASNTANGFLKDSPVTVSTRFVNRGANPKNNIPIQFDVYYGGTNRIYSSAQAIISPGNRFGSATYTFNPIPATTNTVSGLYEVRVFPTTAVDEERRNDTCKVPYFVLGNHDVLAYRILQPFQNAPPLFTKYPVGAGIPIEARFLNVGLNNESNVPVGYEIRQAGSDNLVFSGTAVIPGSFPSASFRDFNLPNWTPPAPGSYCIRIFSNLATDEARINDTLPRSNAPQFCFTAAYEIEIAALNGGVTQQTPNYPLGRPIRMEGLFENRGLTDATNTPATAYVYDPSGNLVYQQTVQISEIVSSGGRTLQRFPDFVPQVSSGSGRYCVGISVRNAADPIAANDSISFCFNVLSPLRGDILVGYGEQYQSIQEARDSLFYLGVSGDVNFLLIDNEYVVTPPKNTDDVPALDFRGEIVGAGPNARITWRPHPAKPMVTIRLKSPSGIGMQFGQIGTSNPSGYMSFDGGPNHKLQIRLEKTGTRDLFVPFFFGRGSSNYTVRNVDIRPYSGTYRCTQRLSLPTYAPGNNRFTFVQDIQQLISAGIMLRNTMPSDPISGSNDLRADTLYNQNNLFEGNTIAGFGYGIASVGAGPIFREQTSRFDAINNQNNVYRGNDISNVSRAGIAVSFETNSVISDNKIHNVYNDCNGPIVGTDEKGPGASATNEGNAVGIWVTAGGNASNNRGYSTGLDIIRNQVSDIRTSSGNGVGIWVENNQDVMITPGAVVQQFPLGGSNIDVQNNFTWNYNGVNWSAGIAMTVATDNSGLTYRPTGNNVENNTIYNPANTGNGAHYGVVAYYGSPDVYNNIIAVLNNGAIGLDYIARTPQYAPESLSIMSDYNLFWVPNGSIGQLRRVSPEGYNLPSPVIAKNLDQWQNLTGLDLNSLVGNVLPEFISTTPGAENLHMRSTQTTTLAGNRGKTIPEISDDVDGEPRGQAAINGRYDIGGDEFWGVVRNNDLVAERLISPFGFRATTGQFSDAQYVMTDSAIDLIGRIRNIGGLPRTSAIVTLDIEHWNGSTWISDSRLTGTVNADVAEAGEVNFGKFQPKTLQEFGMTDATFGTMAPNVTPLYRFVLRTGNDDNLANNRFETTVRFYVQRSKSEIMLSVENYMPGVNASTIADPVIKGNKLNADSILAAMAAIKWDRTGTVSTGSPYDFDLFERDRWPKEALDFDSWQLMMWMQGDEAEGLKPEERWAIKSQQNAWNEYRRAGLFITGQEISRKHDPLLDASNGQIADREFVRLYLRSQHVGPTSPALYDGLRVQGLRITPGRFEVIRSTGVTGDAGPMPSVVRATQGEGVAQGSHWYVDRTNNSGDSLSGMTLATLTRAAVFYAVDIRHWGRFAPEADRSGVQRVVLGAIDFLNQYGSVLPVEVTSFAAEQTGREAVTVRWTTASEKDVVSMQIERAEVISRAEGEELGGATVVADRHPEGGPERGADYTVVDQNVRGGATYEYRLVSVEKDGSRQVVDRARVQITGGTTGALSLEVRPNPVTVRGEIAWRAPRGEEITLQIVDQRGAVVREESITSDGEGVFAIDAATLGSGNYIVLLRSGDEVLEQKLQIRK